MALQALVLSSLALAAPTTAQPAVKQVDIWGVALTLSAFTKWITLPILAMHVLSSVATRQWRRLAIDLLVCAVTAAIIYLPFTIDASIFKTHFDMLMRGGSSAPAQLKGFLLVGFAIVTDGREISVEGVFGRLSILGASYSTVGVVERQHRIDVAVVEAVGERRVHLIRMSDSHAPATLTYRGSGLRDRIARWSCSARADRSMP